MKKAFSHQLSAIRFFIVLSLTACYLTMTISAQAVCPVCTVAVGTGLGLTRYLGVDDLISGIWIGGLLLSSSFWLSDWLSKKNFSFLSLLHTTNYILPTGIFMYLLVLLPLWVSQIIGHPLNTVFGVDKLIFGVILGSLAFLLAIFLDKKVRKIYGHQLFLYQKVVFPVGFLAILSLLTYFIIRP